MAPEPLATAARTAPDHTDAAELDVVMASAGPPLVEDELLVEEVSIDGMCGVY